VVKGTVTDSTGVVVPGVEVTARYQPAAPGPHFDFSFRTYTGPDGSYRINGPALPVAAVHLRLWKEGYHRAGTRQKIEGGATIDLTLTAGSGLRGTIAFAGETPDAVYVATIGMVNGIHNTHGVTVKWDAETRTFHASEAPEGRKRIRISAPGYAPVLSGEYDLVPGREVVLPEITMTPGGVVTGTVLDAAGKPVPGARLSLTIPERSQGGTADEQGRFRLETVPPGRWRLQADHPEVHRVKTVPVTVEDGAVTTVDVRLPEK
jgi:hypothetical protein